MATGETRSSKPSAGAAFPGTSNAQTPELQEAMAARLAQLKAQNETRWTDLFNRQQAERDALFEAGPLNRIRSALFLFKALRQEKPDAGLREIFNVLSSEKLRLELAGRHQLRERKALAKEVRSSAAAARREVQGEFGGKPGPGLS